MSFGAVPRHTRTDGIVPDWTPAGNSIGGIAWIFPLHDGRIVRKTDKATADRPIIRQQRSLWHGNSKRRMLCGKRNRTTCAFRCRGRCCRNRCRYSRLRGSCSGRQSPERHLILPITILVTAFASAWPRVARMTAPMIAPIGFMLPLLSFSTISGLAASASSTAFSRAPSSETTW